MTSETVSALEGVLDRYVAHCEAETGAPPTQEHDPGWSSPCELGDPDAAGRVHWRPRRRGPRADFGGLEAALEVELHPDIKDFYGSFWGAPIELFAEEGGLTLIQIWNDEDFDRLGENVIGHALAKRRIRAPLTVFVAIADEGEFMLSVDNATGTVVLEEPGSLPTREISPNLAAFLNRLSPVPGSD